MKDHVRINLGDQFMICGHCGARETFTPGPTERLTRAIDTFRNTHHLCPAPVFKPGDRVMFCGEEATVKTNHGRDGMVDLGGGQLCRWYWQFQGEPVLLIKRSNRDHALWQWKVYGIDRRKAGRVESGVALDSGAFGQEVPVVHRHDAEAGM